ncbi:MAG: thioredoxin family protein [Myxococcaceae bacterium]|nr:thioredoxin family protein [Myxococcaceae bacterium]
MALPKVLLLAVLAAVGIAFVPFILPTGPTGGDYATELLAGGRILFAAGAIFVGGLFTSMTPCVWPLIPITVGVFGARQADSRGKAVVLTSAYVFGMGVTFAALGVAAAFAGRAFGTALGNPFVAFGLGLFLLALAASMFGAFELALPTGLATRLNTVGGGGLIGALLMGAVSGFLAAPCTGPVLSGVLTFVATTKDPVLGGALLFTYALGIGVPFFIIGVFAMRLPKGGVWMEWVKSVFGVVLVALAIGYWRDGIGPVREVISAVGAALGRSPTIGLTAVLALAGVLAGAIHFSFKDGTRRQAAAKAFGVAALVSALALRMAPLPEPVSPLHHVLEWSSFTADQANSAAPFDALLEKAKATCKPVMIDFFAEWCAACKELDAHTYTSQAVVDEAGRFVNIKVDGTNDHEVLDTLYERFGVKGLPTVAFVAPNGTVLADPKVTGFLPPEKFLAELKKVHSGECSPTP